MLSRKFALAQTGIIKGMQLLGSNLGVVELEWPWRFHLIVNSSDSAFDAIAIGPGTLHACINSPHQGIITTGIHVSYHDG